MTSEDRTIGKVAAFITRPNRSGHDLLLIRHPNAGIQFPAGTVEEGEEVGGAALREATEETGLKHLRILRHVGFQDATVAPPRCLVLRPTPVYARPDAASFGWARFRRGLPVRVHREAGDWTQATYEEWDRYPDPQYLTYAITGWVPSETLCNRTRRHFYHLTVEGATAEEWSVETDNHTFRLFWAPLSDLPEIVSPQDEWLPYVREALAYEFR